MTAEAIARVVADLRAGRVITSDPELADINTSEIDVMADPVVDATAIYRSLVDNPRLVHIYEDHPCIAPPWDCAAICYVNEHGNVVVLLTFITDDRGWSTSEPVDWARVRWALRALIYVGGRSHAQPSPTGGPLYAFGAAIYDSGEPADITWYHLEPRVPRDNWDMALLVWLGALNFLNCRNVTLVEPHRTRPEQRRLARTGVTVQTINVLPIGRSSRSTSPGEPLGVPLTSVRGHFANYGPDFGRGLLFGRYAGRYWIPQHARGSAEHGIIVSDYNLQPASEHGKQP